MAEQEKGRPSDAERARLEAEIMARHSAEDADQTRSALRRLPLVLLTMLLLGLLLRYLAS